MFPTVADRKWPVQTRDTLAKPRAQNSAHRKSTSEAKRQMKWNEINIKTRQKWRLAGSPVQQWLQMVENEQYKRNQQSTR